jgi:hypothetical protein
VPFLAGSGCRGQTTTAVKPLLVSLAEFGNQATSEGLTWGIAFAKNAARPGESESTVAGIYWSNRELARAANSSNLPGEHCVQHTTVLSHGCCRYPSMDKCSGLHSTLRIARIPLLERTRRNGFALTELLGPQPTLDKALTDWPSFGSTTPDFSTARHPHGIFLVKTTATLMVAASLTALRVTGKEQRSVTAYPQ